jgi:putative membrane protein
MRLPAWSARPDIWLLVALLVCLYVYAVRRVGPRHVGAAEPVATRGQVVSYLLGVAFIWGALDWPVDALGDHYLLSVHMFQHMILMLVAPPLFLYGMPAWLLRVLLRPKAVRAVVRQLTRPFVALVFFNGVIVLTHWPSWVDLTLHSEPFHFLSHALLFGSALCMWWPVLSPLPEMPTLSYPGRMLYLFLQSIVPTVPASFLTFGSTPLYRFYTTVPRIWGISAVADQRIAGLEMKLLGGAILFTLIAVIWFKWYGQEQKAEGWDALEWGRVDRELRPQSAPSAPREEAGAR